MLYTTYYASAEPYRILHTNDNTLPIYPLLRSIDTIEYPMHLVSPEHGRSYVVGKRGDRYIVSKGNGLSYSQLTFINTKELSSDTWGLLLRQDAVRDFIVGNEVRNLGIKTNHMEYVIELDKYILLENGTQLKPVLLQYSVECPYRLSDAAYMGHDEIMRWVNKWDSMFPNNNEYHYQTAAEVLIRNLRILQDNGILHNAISNQNYTWALELLDFEIAHSPNYPYTMEDAQRHVLDLYAREIIFTYQIIVQVAGYLHEQVDFRWVDSLFEQYGFDIKQYKVSPR